VRLLLPAWLQAGCQVVDERCGVAAVVVIAPHQVCLRLCCGERVWRLWWVRAVCKRCGPVAACTHGSAWSPADNPNLVPPPSNLLPPCPMNTHNTTQHNTTQHTHTHTHTPVSGSEHPACLTPP
jgi:hypothetical protein